jgi:hypothetical protein
MPKEHCKRKFKWGDTHLGQSCRLKKEYEKNTLESDRAIGEAINLVNCGLRSVVEGSPDQGMDIYRICSSGSWELSSESCPDGKTCSNAPEKVCQAKGFGWDTKFLKNNHGKPLDIKFSVPMSFKRSETRAGEYHFISLSTPQKKQRWKIHCLLAVCPRTSLRTKRKHCAKYASFSFTRK